MSVGLPVEINFLHGGDDDRGRPTEHDDAVDGFERRQEAPAAVKDHVVVSQRGESDCREVNYLFESVNGIECLISGPPDASVTLYNDSAAQSNFPFP
jgi:hypothetical protein